MLGKVVHMASLISDFAYQTINFCGKVTTFYSNCMVNINKKHVSSDVQLQELRFLQTLKNSITVLNILSYALLIKKSTDVVLQYVCGHYICRGGFFHTFYNSALALYTVQTHLWSNMKACSIDGFLMALTHLIWK